MIEILTFAFAAGVGVLTRKIWLQRRLGRSYKLARRIDKVLLIVILILLIVILMSMLAKVFTKNWIEISVIFDWLLLVLTGSTVGYLFHSWLASNSFSFLHLLILMVISLVGIGPDYISRWVDELGILEIGNVTFTPTDTDNISPNVLPDDPSSPSVESLSFQFVFGLLNTLSERIDWDFERIKLLCSSKYLDSCTSSNYHQDLDSIETELEKIKFEIEEIISIVKNGEEENPTAIKDKIEKLESKNFNLNSEFPYPYIKLAHTFLNLLILGKGDEHNHHSKEILEELIEWTNDYKWKINNSEFASVLVVRAYAILDYLLTGSRQFNADRRLDIKLEYIESLQLLMDKLENRGILQEKNKGIFRKKVDRCYHLTAPYRHEDVTKIKAVEDANLALIIIAEIFAKNNYLDIVWRSVPRKNKHITNSIGYRKQIRKYQFEQCFGQLGKVNIKSFPDFVELSKANFLDTDASLTCSFILLDDRKEKIGSTVLYCLSKWSDAISILNGLQQTQPSPSRYSPQAKNISREIAIKQSLLIENKAIHDYFQNGAR